MDHLDAHAVGLAWLRILSGVLLWLGGGRDALDRFVGRRPS